MTAQHPRRAADGRTGGLRLLDDPPTLVRWPSRHGPTHAPHDVRVADDGAVGCSCKSGQCGGTCYRMRDQDALLVIGEACWTCGAPCQVEQRYAGGPVFLTCIRDGWGHARRVATEARAA